MCSALALLYWVLIRSMIKNTGLSLPKFTSFAQVEGRAVQEKYVDVNYSSQTDLLSLCRLSLSAQGQAEEIRQLISPLIEKINHLINVQVQTSQQIQELRNIILQMSCVNRAVTVSLPNLLETDDVAQSIDSLLEKEKEKLAAELPVLNAEQVFGAGYMAPPPVADTLVESIDSLMADDDAQEQEQERSTAQVPIDDMYDDLEHTMRT